MMAEKREIWAFSEKPALLAELIAGARALAGAAGGSVAAVVIGPRELAAEALARGAARAFWLGELAADGLVEEYAATLAGLAGEVRPWLALIGATQRGRVIAGRLAARLGAAAITDVKEIAYEGGELHARHMIFGGGAERVERPLAEPIVITAGAGVFHAEPPAPNAGGEIVAVPFVAPAVRARRVSRSPRPAAAVDLGAAKRVVCAGRGLAQREDLALVEELAAALGAELACSRPLAEGLDWLPRERYIGISGANVRPELYLGVGVSGQVQHTIGMSDSRVVVAINKDARAPIFELADYGIVGDLYAVVPALIRALKERA